MNKNRPKIEPIDFYYPTKGYQNTGVSSGRAIAVESIKPEDIEKIRRRKEKEVEKEMEKELLLRPRTKSEHTNSAWDLDQERLALREEVKDLRSSILEMKEYAEQEAAKAEGWRNDKLMKFMDGIAEHCAATLEGVKKDES